MPVAVFMLADKNKMNYSCCLHQLRLDVGSTPLFAKAAIIFILF